MEVTTTNPHHSGSGPRNPGPNNFNAIISKKTDVDRILKIQYAVKKKVETGYNNLPWVKGKPIVVAVGPFHSESSLLIKFIDVFEVLYGFKINEKSGKINEKSFFNQPENSSISAICYSNFGTFGKFSRIARGHEIYSKFCTGKLSWSGIEYVYDEGTFRPENFTEVIESGYHENFCYGMTVFHNPNAKNKCGSIFGDMALELATNNGCAVIVNAARKQNSKNPSSPIVACQHLIPES